MQTATKPLLRRGLIAAALAAAALTGFAIATTSSPAPRQNQATAKQQTARPRQQQARGRSHIVTARADRGARDGQLGIARRDAAPAWSRPVDSPANARRAIARTSRSTAFEPSDHDEILPRLQRLSHE